MKLSPSNSQSQGENNRETYPTDPRSRRTLSQHFGNPNLRSGRWRRWLNQLRRERVQAVAPTNKVLIVHEESEFRTRGLRFLRKQNKGRLIVPHTRGKGPPIVQAARPILTVPEDSEFLPGLAVLTKTGQQSSGIAACRKSGYSAYHRPCCRRTHIYGITCGLPRTFICLSSRT